MQEQVKRAFQIAKLLCTFVLCSLPVLIEADELSQRELDEIHQAVKQGEIKSLGELLQTVNSLFQGEIVGVEVEKEHGMWVYEFTMVSDTGRLIDIYMDARTGSVVHVENEE